MPVPSLDITVVPSPTVTALFVGGEIDMATAPQLREAALEALRASPPQLDIDLADVTFMDSTGLYVLIATMRRAELLGIGFTLCRLPARITRLLELAGAKDLFSYRDSRSDVEG